MKTKEEVILDILDKQPSVFIQLLQHDRKGLAHTISQILDAVIKLEIEQEKVGERKKVKTSIHENTSQ